ncbi:uncharacterized protein LOC133843220 isoform X4 [Drosophila sulfurigaster albostrigata]|uniref:uncharacterized protein LOC133843220 isoform X4 n=1 Tax=Drosophila sulfurigaster albostrigata TaxID=89887 RepID=UPI002D218DED|nr:uncharacterized protein LOC133843220 isoform X4 [Drosophila sulfurigaster albostrigata]
MVNNRQRIHEKKTTPTPLGHKLQMLDTPVALQDNDINIIHSIIIIIIIIIVIVFIVSGFRSSA